MGERFDLEDIARRRDARLQSEQSEADRAARAAQAEAERAFARHAVAVQVVPEFNDDELPRLFLEFVEAAVQVRLAPVLVSDKTTARHRSFRARIYSPQHARWIWHKNGFAEHRGTFNVFPLFRFVHDHWVAPYGHPDFEQGGCFSTNEMLFYVDHRCHLWLDKGEIRSYRVVPHQTYVRTTDGGTPLGIRWVARAGRDTLLQLEAAGGDANLGFAKRSVEALADAVPRLRKHLTSSMETVLVNDEPPMVYGWRQGDADRPA